MNERKNVRFLTESGIMLSLAMILSFIKIFDAPFGGAVTAGSMIPIIIIALRWGLAKGISVKQIYTKGRSQMKIIIISNGTIENKDVLINAIEDADYIICADGGAKYFYDIDKSPDVIVGDLDSIDDETLSIMKESNIKFHRFPTKKDKTDTELAMDYAVEMGAREITLLGAIGTRLDHTLGNIMLLKKLLRKGIKARIINSHNEVYIMKDSLSLEGNGKDYVSLIPLTEVVRGVTLRGFEYETTDKDFLMDSSFGISNKIIDGKGEINIKEGVCLVIKAQD